MASRRIKWSLESTSSDCLESDLETLASPPAYTSSSSPMDSEVATEVHTGYLIVKKSWEQALAPLKQVPMNLFVIYMSGNGISIFPIMMVGMLFLRPIKSLLAINRTIRSNDNSKAIGQKCIYVLGNLINICIALYKCRRMNLLSIYPSDWLAFVQPQVRQENLGGGISLS